MLKKLISPALLLSAAALWGFAFTAQDASKILPPFTIGALRSVIAAVFLLFLIPLTDSLQKNRRRLISKRGLDFTRSEIFAGCIMGVVLTAASAFQQMGINAGTDGGKAGFITALYVTLVPIYSLFFKKRPKINVVIGVAIAAAGFYLLCIKEDFTVAPSDIFVIVSALIFPLHILVIDRFSADCDGVRASQIQFTVCAILNSALALIFERGVSPDDLFACILPILYLGVYSSGIAYTLQFLGQRGCDPSAASILLSLESVFGAIGSALFLHTTLSPREYAGCAVILAAVIISQLDLSIFKQKAKAKKNKSKGE